MRKPNLRVSLAADAGTQVIQDLSVTYRTLVMLKQTFGPGQPGLRGKQPVGKAERAANASPPTAPTGAKATDHCLRAFLRCMIAAQAGALQQLRERAKFTLQCRRDTAAAPPAGSVPAIAAPVTPSEGAGTGLMTLSQMSYDDSPPWSTDLPQLDELSVNRMVAVSHAQRESGLTPSHSESLHGRCEPACVQRRTSFR